MPARRIDGKAVAERRLAALRAQVAELIATGTTPCLASVTVTDDGGWQIYRRNQTASCTRCGIANRDVRLPDGGGQEDLVELVESLNADPQVHGILVQAPLPEPFDLNQVQSLIGPAKDVEGVNPANLGLVLAGRDGFAPCTARSAFALAVEALGDLRGVEAVIVGASVIVGRPLAQLLVQAGATVTSCHIDTRVVADHTRQADLVVVAVGRPELLRADMVRPGATVIDVGINRVIGADGRRQVVGDVAAEVWERAGAVSPVPGGVGSLTTVILLEHVLAAARRLASERPAIDGAALARILGPLGSELSSDVTDRLADLLSRHLVAGGLGSSRSALERLIDRGLVLMDGGIGTELMARGIAPEELCRANIERPDEVQAVHAAYVEAGSQLLTSNTFACNRYQVGDRVDLGRLVAAGVRLARLAAAGRALVVGSIGPLPRIIDADIGFDEAVDAFAEIALAMVDAGVDGFLCETLASTREARAALAGCRRVSRLPVLLSRCFDGDDEAELGDFARTAGEDGATAIGLNCAGGPRAMLPALRRLAGLSRLPVLARPNAGYPRLVDGVPVYDLRPAWMADNAEAYRQAGVRLIGGCCGVGPRHIAAMVEALRGKPPLPSEVQPSEGHTGTIVAAPAPSSPRAGRGFRSIALLAGRVRMLPARAAAQALAAAGIDAIGIDNGWPGSGPVQAQPSRLRHLQDAGGAPGVLSLVAGSLCAEEAHAVLWSAHLLGIRHILVDAGIFAGGVLHQHGMDPARLVAQAATLNQGRDLRGNRLPEATAFEIGVRLPLDQVQRIGAFAEAGAEFASLQPIYRAADFRAGITAIAGRLPLLAEILVLPDHDTAEELDNEVPALSVPPRLKRLLREDPDKDIRGVLDFLGHWRQRLAGVVLLLPDGRTGPACAVLEGLGTRS